MDITVQNEGTIFLFHLHSEEAVAWVDENVPEPLWFGKALAVEHRYAEDLAQGMLDDGLVLQ